MNKNKIKKLRQGNLIKKKNSRMQLPDKFERFIIIYSPNQK